MEIFLNFGTKRYFKKPQGRQVAAIQAELQKPGLYDLKTVAEGLGSGCNFRPGACNGTDDDSFVSQQVFPLDFDNKTVESFITPEEVIDRAKKAGLPPSFGYPTHSSTEEQAKFRMNWVTDRPVKGAERDHVMKVLMTLFIKHVDRSCSNRSRIFYGGHSGLLYWDPEAVVSVDLLLSMPIDESLEAHGAKGKRKRRTRRKAGGVADQKILDLIAKQNSQGLKRKLGRKQTVFDNDAQFFQYIYKEIDLAELLGVEEGQMFCCFLHDDNEPSANVYRAKSGTWQFHCFGCGETLNLKTLIEEVGGFDSEYQALEFLKEAFNLKIRKTAWAKEQQANIDRILDCLASTGDEGFSALCPVASNNVRGAKLLYIEALIIARGCIFPERMDASGNILFTMSVRQLKRKAGKSSNDKVSKYLKMLEYHKLLEIVPDAKVPQKILESARKVQQPGQNHTQFYSIPSWVHKHLTEVEEAGRRWKRNNYRLSGISYEMFLRSEGPEVAGALYPQSSQIQRKDGTTFTRQTSKAADARHDEIAGIILEMIDSRGYATEAEVIAMASSSRGMNEVQLKRSLTDICGSYGLKKVRASRALKTKYGIGGSPRSFPSIIIRED